MVELQNFEGIGPIFFGLSSPSSISKLVDENLSKELLQTKNKIEALLAPNFNYQLYRSSLQNCNKLSPHVLQQCVLLKDLAVLEENEDFVDASQTQINWFKYSLVGDLLENIRLSKESFKPLGEDMGSVNRFVVHSFRNRMSEDKIDEINTYLRSNSNTPSKSSTRHRVLGKKSFSTHDKKSPYTSPISTDSDSSSIDSSLKSQHEKLDKHKSEKNSSFTARAGSKTMNLHFNNKDHHHKERESKNKDDGIKGESFGSLNQVKTNSGMLLNFIPRNQENKDRDMSVSQFKESTPENLSPRDDNTGSEDLMSAVDAIKSILTTEDFNQSVNSNSNSNNSTPNKHKKEGKGRKGRSKQNSLVLEMDKGNTKKNDKDISITIDEGNSTNTQGSGNNEEKSNDKSNENENKNSDFIVLKLTTTSNLSNNSTPNTSAYNSPQTLSPSTSVQNFLFHNSNSSNHNPTIQVSDQTENLTKTNSEGATELPKQVHSIKGMREKSNSLSHAFMSPRNKRASDSILGTNLKETM